MGKRGYYRRRLGGYIVLLACIARLLARAVAICTFSLLVWHLPQVLTDDGMLCAAEPSLIKIQVTDTDSSPQVPSVTSPSELLTPMVMLTFELDSGYTEFAGMYRAKPDEVLPYYIAPYLQVLGMSHDGSFHAVHTKQRPLGCFSQLLSEKRRDLHPIEFTTISDRDLMRALGSDSAECAFLYDVNDILLITTFVPADVIEGNNTEFPLFDASGYLTARIPANNYTTFFRTLSEDCADEASVYYERFGETHKEWYENRRSGNYPVFGNGRHPSFPFGSPHVRWLVISGQAVRDKLVPHLRRAFESHMSTFSGSVAWTSGIGAAHDVLQMPPILLYQTYSVTLEPKLASELMEPQQMASIIEKWPSVMVGMYVVEDGNIQLVFFEGADE